MHPFRPDELVPRVTITSPLAFMASDAKAIVHSIADSLLSAAGLPDIGTL